MTDDEDKPRINPALGIAAVAAATPLVQMAVDGIHTLLGREENTDFEKRVENPPESS